MKNAIIVHYHTSHGNYSHKSLWSWREGQLGRDTFFTRYDSFGAVASLEFSSEEAIFQVSMIIKEPQWKNKSHEYSCHRDYGFGKTEIWLVDGDETVYYSRQSLLFQVHHILFEEIMPLIWQSTALLSIKSGAFLDGLAFNTTRKKHVFVYGLQQLKLLV